MKTAITIVTILSLAAGSLYSTGTAAGQPPPIPTQEQPQVLTRGPVHEAFAEPVILQVQASLVVPNQPWDEIEEIPPTDRPRGDNYVWVPGYWSWDEDRNNYIWVSGCWRAAPPNMSWVPGYWSQVPGGWEWVAGFWTPDGIQDIEYLPAPPAFDDEQPTNRQPSRDYIWVPSCQYWNHDHYVRRPGYWLAANPNWVWTPSHYVWTPRGYIFCDGHWDYPIEDRGLLFAPVYFPPSVYRQSRFSYSPSIVVDLGGLVVNLFTYPRYSHYYFGDYYDDAYLSIGIFPRHEVERNHTWYDPTYVYDRWHHGRDEPRWVENEQHDYDRRHADRDLRPARTYQETENRQANRSPEQRRNDVRMAEPLTVVVANEETSLKFERIDNKAQQKIVTQATTARKFSAERSRWESTPARQEKVQPLTESKGSVTPPAERKVQVTQPNEARTPNVPQGDVRKTQPTETRTPSVPQCDVRKTQPTETKTPNVPQGDVRKTQPTETKAPNVPPGSVRKTQPERVKVPTPPIVGKQGAAEKRPPPQPVNERKDIGVVKDTPNQIQPAGTTKDKGKVGVKETPKKIQPANNAKDKGKAKVKDTPKEKQPTDQTKDKGK